MKKTLRLFLMTLFLAGAFQAQAQRYLGEVFTGVTVTADVEYAQNITVITGSPTLDTLYCDVYEPTGDTLADRPIVLISHTGSFLPTPQNGQITGTRKDSAVVEMCMQFAKRGFVAVAYTYRKGWNPVGSTVEIRSGTLLNAAYRGVQDTRTAVRFFKKNAATYGVDSTRVIVGGLGTGGYLSYASATLDKYSEIELPQFIDPVALTSYVDTANSGDLWGTNTRPLNIANHVNSSSEIHMAFAVGGALGDSSWLEAGDVPMVGFQCPGDPFAPYNYGAVIVPTTGEFVINASGSGHVIAIANALGNQDVWADKVLDGPYTDAADANNGGNEGLFPFVRPPGEGSPWEWWDSIPWNGVPHPSGGTFHSVGLLTNPDMSAAKGRTYIDSIMGYISPRIVCALDLDGCVTVGIEDDAVASQLTLYPNPAGNKVEVILRKATEPIRSISLYDLNGRLVREQNEVNNFHYSLERNTLPSGVYFVKVNTSKGTATQKLIFQ